MSRRTAALVMRRHLLVALALAGVTVLVGAARATPAHSYSGTHFGDGNLPAGCVADRSPTNPANVCHHIKVGLNSLDEAQVNIVLAVPASPYAERDMRIMRQAVDMWDGGIHDLAGPMGLGWLANGVSFHVAGDVADLASGTVVTDPLTHPDIVVIATNPTKSAGIGIDPITAVEPERKLLGLPCLGPSNAFDPAFWQGLPGFDSHHGKGSGTYLAADCDGSGKTTCFAINAGLDPVPGVVDTRPLATSLFDLVAHEFGHCLTLGHVGDGAEGAWGVVPTNDLMSYNTSSGRDKCVSTLDVEGFAVRMSRYLDRNGDGAVTAADRLQPNDVAGDGTSSFQVQNPADHFYASSSGAPQDCPKPDDGLLPGTEPDWEP